MTRPSSSVFADGTKRSRPLALHPEAIGVAYPTREVRDRDTYEKRAIVASDVADIVDGVAVLSIDGPLEHKGSESWWGGFWQTYEGLASDFKLLCDDSSVSAIVLKFDSPGGDVAGLNETVRIMQGMKQSSRKRVIAYVDEACYSAAYALAMVADEIYLPESGGVGSIGVITAMADQTERDKKDGLRVEVIASGSRKADGHPHVPLTDGAIARTKRTVDKLASSFFRLVSMGRGLSTKTIEGFQAGTFSGFDAVDSGLADGVMSLKECLTLVRDVYTSQNGAAKSALPKDENMSRLAAEKALKDANLALSKAKSDSDRALCAARVVSAESVLAKVKKTKTVTTDTHEESIDDGEEETAEMPDDEEEPTDDEDEDEEAVVSSAAKLNERSFSSGKTSNIIALARKITGKTSDDEVLGALQAMADSHRKTSKLAAEVAALKADAEQGKISALIATGLKAGKLAPSQRAWAKTQSPAGLKAYLDAAPSMVATADGGRTEASVSGTAEGAVTAEQAKIWRKMGFKEADYPKLLEAMNKNFKPSNGAH